MWSGKVQKAQRSTLIFGVLFQTEEQEEMHRRHFARHYPFIRYFSAGSDVPADSTGRESAWARMRIISKIAPGSDVPDLPN
jgi:hypothetical protein